MTVVTTINAEILARGTRNAGLSQAKHLGDVNGDGFGDYAVVAFGNLGGGPGPKLGPQVTVELGTPERPATPEVIGQGFDPGASGETNFSFGLLPGIDVAENFTVLPLGDYDDNGQSDILFAFRGFAGRPDARATVYTGGPEGFDDLSSLLFQGPVTGSLAATGSPGDITGDGIPDVVFAFGEQFSSRPDATIAVTPGSAVRNSRLPQVLVTRNDPFTANVIPVALIELGDVSGDGIADLGVMFRDNTLYVLFGGAHLADPLGDEVDPATIDIEALVADGLAARIEGDFAQREFWAPGEIPMAVASAHIDGDDVLDIVIGTGVPVIAGAAFLPRDGVLVAVSGGASLAGRTVSLEFDQSGGGGLAAPEAGVITLDFDSGPSSPVPRALGLGQALSGGDFDGDGRDDLAFWMGDGRIGVLTGGVGPEDVDALGRVDLGAPGTDVTLVFMDELGLEPLAFDRDAFDSPNLGFTLDLSGDIDGDGFDDLLIGLPAGDLPDITSDGPLTEGAVLAAFGAPTVGRVPLVPIVGDTITVNTLADTVDSNIAVTSLREAAQAANVARRPITIELGPGRHVLENAGLTVTGDVTILGEGRSGPDATVIEGAASLLPEALFSVRPGASLSLASLELTNASEDDVSEMRSEQITIPLGKRNLPAAKDVALIDGRGVTVDGGRFVADDVLFSELGSYSKQLVESVSSGFKALSFTTNVTYSPTEGGAIFARDSVVEILGSTFSGNGAAFGGAIAQRGGELSIEDTTFSMNRSADDIRLTYRGGGDFEKANVSGAKGFVPKKM